MSMPFSRFYKLKFVHFLRVLFHLGAVQEEFVAPGP